MKITIHRRNQEAEEKIISQKAVTENVQAAIADKQVFFCQVTWPSGGVYCEFERFL